MSQKKICDNCGAESPDKKGLYIGNHWVTVHVEWWDRWAHAADYDFCVPCAKGAVDALAALKHGTLAYHLRMVGSQ